MKHPIIQLVDCVVLVLGAQPQPNVFHDFSTWINVATKQINVVVVQQLLGNQVCLTIIEAVQRRQVAQKNTLKVSKGVSFSCVDPGQVVLRTEKVV